MVILLKGGLMNISGSSTSAMAAFGTQMNVTANNIANVNTDGFKRSRTVMEEAPGQGVNARVEKINTPGPLVQQSIEEGGVKELSNVDLAQEITSTIPAQRGYEANLKMAMTKDEILGTMIDMKA